MKLELKHLAPYLPYKIKMLHYDKKKVLNAGQGSSVHWVGITHALNHQENTKPLLHPLSRLTEEIVHNSEVFVPIDSIGEYNEQISESMFNVCQNDYVTDADYDVIQYLKECKYPKLAEHHIYFLPFGLIQKLFEWHFDVFGLIEKGLAEPIETSKAKGNEAK